MIKHIGCFYVEFRDGLYYYTFSPEIFFGHENFGITLKFLKWVITIGYSRFLSSKLLDFKS